MNNDMEYAKREINWYHKTNRHPIASPYMVDDNGIDDNGDEDNILPLY